MAQSIQPVRQRRAQAASSTPASPPATEDSPVTGELPPETGAKISTDTIASLDHALVDVRQDQEDISEAFAGFCGFFNAVLERQGHQDTLGGHPLRLRIAIGTVDTEVDLVQFRAILGEEAFDQYLTNWLTYYHVRLREAARKLAEDAAKLVQVLP